MDPIGTPIGSMRVFFLSLLWAWRGVVSEFGIFYFIFFWGLFSMGGGG
jgi:hypothetical protein